MDSYMSFDNNNPTDSIELKDVWTGHELLHFLLKEGNQRMIHSSEIPYSIRNELEKRFKKISEPFFLLTKDQKNCGCPTLHGKSSGFEIYTENYKKMIVKASIDGDGYKS